MTTPLSASAVFRRAGDRGRSYAFETASRSPVTLRLLARRSNRDVDRGAVALFRRRYGQRRQDDLDFRAVGCPDLDLSAVAINICNLARHDVTHHPTGDAGVSGRSR